MSCDIAAEGYYIDEVGKSLPCPANAYCAGDTYLPRPQQGYFIDRSKLEYAGRVYACLHATCKSELGANHSVCWTPRYFNESWLDQHHVNCLLNSFTCAKGSTGPLCGTCQNGYFFAVADQTCELCGNSWLKLPVLVFLACALLFFSFSFLVSRIKSFKQHVMDLWIVQLLKKVDGGLLRVLWSNYQVR